MRHDLRSRVVRLAVLAALVFVFWAPAAAVAAAAPAGAPLPRLLVPAAPTPDTVRSRAGDDRLLLMAAGIFDPTAERIDFRSFGWSDARPGRYGIVQVQVDKGGAKELEALGLEVVGYLPNHAFQVRWDADSRARLAGSATARWSSDYPPGFKVAPALWPGQSLAADQRVNVVGFRRGQLDVVETALLREFPDARLVGRVTTSPQPQSRFRVPPEQLAAFVARAAELEDVSWIEPWRLPQLHNDQAVPVIQNNSVAGMPIWDQDLIGAGQIVAVADSGLDRNQCWFTQHNDGVSTNTDITNAENVTPPALGSTFPLRKVFAYWVAPGASPYDDTMTCPGGSPTSFHGSHTTGTIVGDRGTVATPTDPAFLSTDRDGMAPNAQILFQDIGNDSTGCLAGAAGDIGLLFRQARDGGAHISSNSWGSDTAGAYTAEDQEADAAAWSLEDMLIVFSAGNSGPTAGTTGSPGNAKNVLTVGALGHGADPTVAGFSSRGPTDDSRQKPDITAPGSSVVSARGDDTDTATQCPATGRTLSGTSMAAPTVAGGAALMREYFTEGFYPSGARTSGDALAPSAALMKATLLNGTAAIAPMPGSDIGWGRIHLDSNLFFASIAGHRRLRTWSKPNDAGLVTGLLDSYSLGVPSGAELRVTLAWMDVTPSLGAAVQLVNNLDLEVVAPDGTTTYRGNVFTAGQSTTGGSADNRNTVEQVRLLLPTAGTYTLRVRGLSIPGNGEAYTQKQGYALVASYGGCTEGFSGAPANPVATDLGAGGIQVGFDAVTGATSYSIYRADGNCSAPAESFQMVGTTSGSPFADTSVNGGFAYAYKVRAADTCAEGPLSTCVTASATGPCSLVPNFDATSTTVANHGSTAICDVDLSWSAGTSSCPLSPSVAYNIYRSTQPSFVPGPSNLYAGGVSGTTFVDATMNPLTTYFYVVRAQDGSAPPNEAPNSRRLKIVPTASTSSPGTFADGADAPSYVQLESPWQITSQLAAAGTLSYHNAGDNQNYLPDTCASITTPDLLLSASATLSYAARWNLETQFDGVVVEISTNGGGTWTNLPPVGGYPGNFSQTGSPPINACAYPASQGAFNGSSGGVFQTKTSNLAMFAGQTVRIRWRFSSDPGAEEAGFFLDSVSVTNAQTPDPCVSSDLPFVNGFESGTFGAWTGGASP